MGAPNETDNTPTPSPRSPRFLTSLINLVVLMTTTLFVVAVGEGLFRYRFGPGGYHPPEAVLRIQEYLVANPVYGFAWRPNVREDENIVFDVADVAFRPLSTDGNGLINHPSASLDRPIDILGLGDSFVEHAAHTWFELAQERGFAYYSMALHRTAPPQYARIFESHGASADPDWIVVGVFENDFTETSDFLEWSDSAMDWFEYHSGTWCGPPVDNSLRAKLADGLFQGWHHAYRNARATLRGDRMTIAGPTHDEITGVTKALREIVADAQGIPARVLIVFIPSKPTAINTPTKEAVAYDTVIGALEQAGRVDVLDLRSAFREHADPRSLYYEVDGHWNRAGMEFAGQLIFDYIQRTESIAAPAQ